MNTLNLSRRELLRAALTLAGVAIAAPLIPKEESPAPHFLGWHDAASDPLADIKAARDQILNATVFEVKSIVIHESTYKRIKDEFGIDMLNRDTQKELAAQAILPRFVVVVRDDYTKPPRELPDAI